MNNYTLLKLRPILNEFGLLSGLKCSIDKRKLLQVGTNYSIPGEITELGFSIGNELTVLELIIVSHGTSFNTSLEQTAEKNSETGKPPVYFALV
jgi:hypothetical protein